jgi:probable rRNA maturation factor
LASPDARIMTDKSRNNDFGADRFQIALANDQLRYPVDESQLIHAANSVLQDSDFLSANISLAVIDDETMHELNRRHLDHDYPTDVLSFVLDDEGDHLEGEVILSADTAASVAEELGHAAAQEQLLYVIHGMLHLVGYDDKSTADAEEMRAAEERYLQQFGVKLSRRTAL